MRRPRTLSVLSVLLVLVSCGPSLRQRTAATLDDVGSFINEHPDSALAVLDGVDSTTLTTRAIRARYSLLHVMALDKCFKDITAPGLLDPAVEWYSGHGSPDDRFKVWHYAGRIAQDQGKRGPAALNYSRAEALADQVQDRHALGLMYLSFGSLYNSVHNTQKEQEYIQKALDVFRAADDPMSASAIAQMALIYHSLQEWEKADSLYRVGLDQAVAYPKARQVYLSNYARMKLLQPDKDPLGAITLLDELRQNNGGALTPKEAGAYAYALALSGDDKTAKAMFRQLEGMEKSRDAVLVWLYYKALFDGKTDKALSLLQEMWKMQDATVRDDLTDSIASVLQKYYSLQASHERDRKRIILLLALSIIFLLAGVILGLLLHKRNVDAERDRLMSICNALRQDLGKQEDQLTVLSGELQRTREMQSEQTREFSAQIEEARASYRRERLARLRQVGDVASVVLQQERKRVDNEWAWKKLREELFYIHHLEKNGEELVRRMDLDLNGAISRLRSDLSLRGQPQEVLFLCCCILDIDAQLLADLFGKSSVDSIYKKRSRFKEKIAALNNPEYDLLFKIRRSV